MWTFCVFVVNVLWMMWTKFVVDFLCICSAGMFVADADILWMCGGCFVGVLRIKGKTPAAYYFGHSAHCAVILCRILCIVNTGHFGYYNINYIYRCNL